MQRWLVSFISVAISDWLVGYPGQYVENFKANSESAGKALVTPGMNARGEKGAGAVGLLFHPPRASAEWRLCSCSQLLAPFPARRFYIPTCDCEGMAALPLSRVRYIHVLQLGSSAEFVLTRRIWEKDVAYSTSKQNVFKCPCFSSAPCSFFFSFPQAIRTAGPSKTWEQGRSPRPTSADWWKWEVNIMQVPEILEVWLQPSWPIQWIHSVSRVNLGSTNKYCHFAWLLVLVFLGWFLVNI